jgi:hypothetical protein
LITVDHFASADCLDWASFLSGDIDAVMETGAAPAEMGVDASGYGPDHSVVRQIAGCRDCRNSYNRIGRGNHFHWQLAGRPGNKQSLSDTNLIRISEPIETRQLRVAQIIRLANTI